MKKFSPVLERLEDRTLFSVDFLALPPIESANENLQDDNLANEFSFGEPVTDTSNNQDAIATELVIIDSRVPDTELIIEELVKQQQSGRELQIHVIENTEDGLQKISALLKDNTSSAIHVISHGSSSGFQLGATWIDSNTVEENSDQINSWKTALTDSADILLYGCNLSLTDSGEQLATLLSTLTGADIATSNNATGHSAFNADWVLENHTGPIDSASIATDTLAESWHHSLPTGTTDILFGSPTNQDLQGSAGNDILFYGEDNFQSNGDHLGDFNFEAGTANQSQYNLTTGNSGVIVNAGSIHFIAEDGPNNLGGSDNLVVPGDGRAIVLNGAEIDIPLTGLGQGSEYAIALYLGGLTDGVHTIALEANGVIVEKTVDMPAGNNYSSMDWQPVAFTVDFSISALKVSSISGTPIIAALRVINTSSMPLTSISMDGGAGNDIMVYGADSNIIVDGPGNDTIFSGSGDDKFTSDGSTSGGNDTFEGGSGQDEYIDGAGDDIAYGGKGGDTLTDGPGSDIYSGNFGSDTLNIYYDSPTDENQFIGGGGNDTYNLRNNVNANFTITGSDYDDSDKLSLQYSGSGPNTFLFPDAFSADDAGLKFININNSADPTITTTTGNSVDWDFSHLLYMNDSIIVEGGTGDDTFYPNYFSSVEYRGGDGQDTIILPDRINEYQIDRLGNGTITDDSESVAVTYSNLNTTGTATGSIENIDFADFRYIVEDGSIEALPNTIYNSGSIPNIEVKFDDQLGQDLVESIDLSDLEFSPTYNTVAANNTEYLYIFSTNTGALTLHNIDNSDDLTAIPPNFIDVYGTLSKINEHLASVPINYSYQSTDPNIIADELTITAIEVLSPPGASQMELGTTTTSVTIPITINHDPVLSSIETSKQIYTEGTPIPISSTIELTDLNLSEITSASVRFFEFDPNEDQLEFLATTNISSSYDAITGKLTLTGNDTVVDYETALRSITYSNSSENPNTALTREIAFEVRDDQGVSNTIIRTLDVVSVNDAPALTSIETGAAYYIENTSVGLTGNLLLTDVDDTHIETATVSIVNNFVAGEDVLEFTDQHGITGNYDTTSGQLVLTGPATVAAFEKAIHTVSYQNNSDDPSTLARSVEFIINDGDNDSNVLSRNIKILAKNDSPFITINTGTNTTVGGIATINNTMLNEGDPDDEGIELTYTAISASISNGQLEFSNNLGVAVTTFTQADIDSGILTFVHDGLSILDGSFDFTLNDGGEDNAFSVTDTFVITVAGALSDAYTTDEDSALSVATPGLLANDSAGTVAYIDDSMTLGTVSVSPNGGFDYQPNGAFEHLNAGQSATDSFDYTYEDGNGNQQTVTSTITITGVNDAPQLASIETAPAFYIENNPGVGLTGNLSVTDIDDPQIQNATVSITGNFESGEDILSMAAQPNIVASYSTVSGVLTLTGPATAAEFEVAIHSVTYSNNSDNPVAATRTVEFVVNDGDVNSVAKYRDITIIPVNDHPTITVNTGTSSMVGDEVTITNAMLNSFDPDDNNLLYYTSGYTNGRLFYGSSPVSIFSQGLIDSGDLVFVHDGLSTQNGSFDFSLEDGGEDGTPPIPGTFVINVTGAMPDAYTTDEDTTLSAPAPGLLTNDSPGNGTTPFIAGINDSATLGLVSATSGGGFGYNPNGAFQYLAPGEFANDSFDYTFNDGNGNQQTVATTITVTGVNDAPRLTTIEGQPALYIENSTGVGLTGNLTVTDIDDSIIQNATVSITGNFEQGEDELTMVQQPNVTASYNDASGVLTLTGASASTSDFESAFHAITYTNKSNDPSVTARTIEFVINDGEANSEPQYREITIIPVNDPPEIVTNNGASTSVGGAVKILSSMLNELDRDDDGTALTYTATNVSNGQLELINNPGIAVTSFTETDKANRLVKFVHDGLSSQNGSFDFTLADGGEDNAAPETGTFVIRVSGALPDNYSTDENTLLSIATPGLLSNDSSGNGSTPVVASIDNSTTSGSVLVSANGSFKYDPNGAFEYLAPGQTATDAFNYTFDDGNSNQQTVSATITINGVNDAPTLTSIEGQPALYTENNTGIGLTGNLSVADIDDSLIQNATVSIIGNFETSEDVLTMAALPNIVASYSTVSGVLTLTGPATAAEFEAAIHSVTYSNNSDNPSLLTRTVEFSVFDDEGESAVRTREISVFAVNDSPIISLNTGVNSTIGATSIITNSMLNEGDLDDSGNEITYTVNNISNGQLEFTTNSGVAITAFTQATIDSGTLAFVHDGFTKQNGSFDFSLADGGENNALAATDTFIINIVGALPDSYAIDEDTILNVNAATGLLANDTQTPGASVLSIDTTSTIGIVTYSPTGSFNYNSDGAFEGLGSNQTATDSFNYRYSDVNGTQQIATATITINGINDAPTLPSFEDSDAIYTENNTGLIITTGIDLLDIDDTLMESATVSITGNFDANEDILSIPRQANIFGVYNNTTGVLSLNAQPTATTAEFKSALRMVTYTNTSDNPSTATRTIEFIVNDGENLSDARYRNIQIEPINDSPLIATNMDANSAVGGTSAITNVLLNGGDLDDTGTGLTYTATAIGNGQLELSSNPGIAVTTFTQEAIDSGKLTFVHDGLTTADGSFAFSLADGGENNSLPATGTYIINVVGALPDAYATDENTVLSVNASTGVLSNDTLSPNAFVMGVDTSGTTGSVAFLPNGSFEYQPNGMFETLEAGQTATDSFDYTYNDSNGNLQTVATDITINGRNDAPVLSAIEAEIANYIENDTGINLTNSLLLTDVDDALIDSATVSISNNFKQGEDVISFTNQLGINGNYNSANGILSLTGSANTLDYQTAIQAINYSNASDSPSTLTRTIDIAVNDGSSSSNMVSRDISVTAVNDAPELSSIEIAPALFSENSPVSITGNLNITDVDSPNIESATVSISNNFAQDEDVITFTDQKGITGSYNPDNGILSLNGSANPQDYQAAIQSITYNNTSDSASTLTRTVDIAVNDSSSSSKVVSRDISVTSVNDATVLSSIEIAPALFTENTPVSITNNLNITDVDSPNIESATISINNNFAQGEDVITFTDQLGITGSYNPDDGILSLNGSASPQNYQTAIQSIAYNNTSDSPSTLTRTVDIAVNDGSSSSNVVSRDISVTSVNDATVLSSIEVTPVLFTENTPVNITNNLNITDFDSPNIESATVSISNNFAQGEDVITFTDQLGITGSYNPDNGILSLNGSASPQDYQTAIQSITYNNTSDSPSTLTRTVDIAVNDGSSSSKVVSRDISVTSVNDATVLSSIEIAPVLFTENTPVSITDNLNITDADDSTIESATVSISNNFVQGEDVITFSDQLGITGSYNPDKGILSLTGSASAQEYQTAIRTAIYNNTSDNPSTSPRTIGITVDNGSDISNTVSRNLTVSALNDAPVLSNIESVPALFQEKANPLGITNTLVANDADNTTIESAVVSITNNFNSTEDNISFNNQADIAGSFDPTTGIMTLNGSASVADYINALRSVSYHNTSDAPSTVARTIEFTVFDGNDNSNPLSRDIYINEINDAPILSGVSNTTTLEDKGLRLDLNTMLDLFQATDIDGTISAFRISEISNGSLELATSLSYVPPIGGNSSNTIDNNRIAFWTPSADANTDQTGSQTSLTIHAIDNDGKSSLDAATLLIDTISVNDAPSGSDKEITINENSTYQLRIEDFGFSDRDNNNFHSVIVTDLPDSGQLLLANSNVQPDAQISISDISNGLLTYQHSADVSSQLVTQVGFQVQDDGGTEHGGEATDLEHNFLTLIKEIAPPSTTVVTHNYNLPFSETLNVSEESVSLLIIDLNDDFTIELVSQPSVGIVDIATDGTLTYTHNGSQVLTDSFTYQITNSDGAITEATVNVSIDPPIAQAIDTPVVLYPTSTVESEEATDVETEEPVASTQLNDAPNKSVLTQPDESSAVAIVPKSNNTSPVELVVAGTDDFSTISGGFENKILQHKKWTISNTNETPGSLVQVGGQSDQGVSLKDLFSSDAEQFTARNSKLVESIDERRELLKNTQSANFELASRTVTISSGLSVGYVIWLLRGGLLLGSVISAMPAWRSFDPLPVLDGLSGDDDDDTESLESMVETDDPEDQPEDQKEPKTEAQTDQ